MKKLLLLGMLLCTSASAADLTVQGGWLHTPNSNYGDSAGLVGRLQQPVYSDLDAGIEASYHGPQSHNQYGSISGYHLLGEAIYNVPVKWVAKPYILGGWGWSWWNFNRSQDTIDRGIEVNLGNSFAQKYAIGANYPIGNGWSINLEWSYFQSAVPKDSFYSATGLPSAILGDDNRSGKIRVGQGETSLMAGVKYEW